MAKELRSVEMLRNDFVNNFSHEFKTPIVSIRGFAKILKMNHLTLEERDKYLNIIIEESERLADLSTNVLNLSKIEQQTKKQISVSISNQGNPIPTEIAAHIFDKFYQGDTSHTTRGYGLGLTIAKKIIELHNGFISVSSIDEEKVVFHVSLDKW